MRFDIEHDLQTHKLELKMKNHPNPAGPCYRRRCPLAAQAESPDAIKFNDAPSTLSAAQVRADYLAMD